MASSISPARAGGPVDIPGAGKPIVTSLLLKRISGMCLPVCMQNSEDRATLKFAESRRLPDIGWASCEIVTNSSP